MKSKYSYFAAPILVALLATSCATKNERIAREINYEVLNNPALVKNAADGIGNTISTRGIVQSVVALDINPGNVAVSKDGRIFSSVHQMRSAPYKLIEIDPSTNSYKPFPDESWNKNVPGDYVLNAVLGIQIDSLDRLWVMDNGNLMPPQTPKLLAFDINSGRQLLRYDFPAAIGPKGSMIQDLAVDETSGYIYLADLGMDHKPALIVLNINNLEAHRYEGLKQFMPENVDINIDGKVITATKNGITKPARNGIDPITLSSDKQTLFFGPMNGHAWYAVPTSVLKSAPDAATLSHNIKRVGTKPVSDGAATDIFGNHYFTDLNNNAITVLRPDGKTQVIAQNPALSWPDNISIGNDGWLYVSVNQLHKSPYFNKGVDGGQLPYRIVRVKVAE